MKIFVYGTLRKEGWNHGLMDDVDSEFVCFAKTKEPRILVDKGIPYMFNTNTSQDGAETDNQPIGEIYEVQNVAPIDRLESNGFHYQRQVETFIKITPVEDEDRPHEYEDTEEEVEAWVYYSVNERVPPMTDFITDFIKGVA